MEDLETVLPSGVQVSTIEPARAKDGHITLRLRVIGPRDRAVELVRNLEHSKRFLLPRIVGENAESTGGPGQKMEIVSASNRVDFDVLAEYNPALPGERKAARKPAPISEDSGSQPAPHRGHPLSGPVFIPPPRTDQEPGRPPYTGPAQPMTPQPKPKPKPNPSLYPAPGGPQ
jgi:type IV pilus assembly protein PilN